MDSHHLNCEPSIDVGYTFELQPWLKSLASMVYILPIIVYEVFVMTTFTLRGYGLTKPDRTTNAGKFGVKLYEIVFQYTIDN